ncbi:MAG: LamG domain-containing protein, partial [Patescibacteria group bacterium]
NRVLSAVEVSALYNSGAAKFNVSPTKYLTDGLVGYWTMDGSKVNWKTGAVTDSSGKGNTGFVTLMATGTAPAIGRVGQALNFDGVNDYVDAGSNSSLDNITVKTMTAWIYLNGFGESNFGRILDKSNLQSSPNGGFLWHVCNDSVTCTNTRNLAFTQVFSTASGRWTTPDSSIKLNTWQHVAVVYNKSSSANDPIMYIDGASVAVTESVTPSGTVDTDSARSLTIGNTLDTTRSFDGLIDDVRIYNRVLSAVEVSALYNSGAAKFNVSPTKYLTDGLVGYWTMDGSKVNWKTGAVTDSSGRGNTGFVKLMATGTAPAIGRVGQALNFDGVDDYVDVDNPAVFGLMSSISVSAWIYTSVDGSVGGDIVNKRSLGGSAFGWAFKRIDTGALRLNFVMDHATTDLTVTTNNNALVINQWQHVVATFASSTVQNLATDVHIYVNGIEASYATQTNGVGARKDDSSRDLTISGHGGNLGELFNGKIDDVRIYNRALGANEVQRLYNIGR